MNSVASLLQTEKIDGSTIDRFIIATEIECRGPKKGKRSRKSRSEILLGLLVAGGNVSDEDLQSSGLRVCHSLPEAERCSDEASKSIDDNRHSVAWACEKLSAKDILINLWRDM